MQGRSFKQSLIRSLERQRRLFGSSIILTPVDSIPLFYDEQDFASFLHGLYVSDKVRSENQKQQSIIQVACRDRGTWDLNRIHKQFAECLGASEGSLRLLSGLHAHIAVFMSLAGIGESVLLLPEIAGGHFSTKGILQRLGLRVIEMAVDLDNFCIDRARTLAIVDEQAPDFVFVDRSEGLRYEDFRFLGSLKGPVKVFDASHYLTQIICRQYENPLSWGFDLLLFTVHKSFPGPQKAGVVTQKSDELWQALQKGIGQLVSSSHVENSYLAGLVLSKDEELSTYASRLLENALVLEDELLRLGVPVFRRSRQGDESWPVTQHLWLPMKSQESAYQLYKSLARARLHTNYRLLPYKLGWGIRMGTTAASVNGLLKDSAKELADIIGQIFFRGYSLHARHRVRDLSLRMRPHRMTSWPNRLTNYSTLT
jgi:glycine hydroxymethyltransferase